MKIAILSGKGGTGKTLVSVNLAAVASKSIYIDCDVEEPNGYLFFKPKDVQEELVNVKIPEVNSNCNGCCKCVDFCKFNALAYVKDKLYIFNEVCHSCGGCVLLCDEKALVEKDKVVGKIETGAFENVVVSTGILNIGEASGVPIIRQLLEEYKLETDIATFIDCPPGSACTVMESIKDADYCLLVAEPTIFGLHNLNMVYELVLLFKKPFGIIINKFIDENNSIEEFCKKRNIDVLERISYNEELGTINSNAKIAVLESDRYNMLFSSLLNKIIEGAK